MYSNSKNINYNLEGSTAPLAVLFMMVSMFFTISYLKNSFNQSAMEEYRYAEKKALYSAEAGLNDVGIVVLPKITTSDTTFLPPPGVNYGADENGDPIGKYYNIHCYTDLIGTQTGFFAEASGEASYTSPNGNDIKIVRTVGTTMLPDDFSKFMYFTDKEDPVGPGNTGMVNFCGADELEGRVHTNGFIDFCNGGNCPTFTGSITITNEGGYDDEFDCDASYGACWPEFVDDDDNCIGKVVPKFQYPPINALAVARDAADRVFTADDLIFRPGKKDTLIMTEIQFADNGYYATQWWYNIPPVSGPPVEFDFYYDSSATGVGDRDSGRVHMSFNNLFDYGAGEYILTQQGMFLGSTWDTTGNEVATEIIGMINAGDIIHVQNESQTKMIQFTASGANPWGPDAFLINYDTTTYSYTYTGSLPVQPFFDDEPVKLINTSATQGWAEDVEWNTPDGNYWHDHFDISDWDDNGETGETDYCTPGQMQHFDFMYWTQGDIFDGPGSAVYQSDYVYKERTFYPVNGPHVIYVKGGQVLVRGVVNGQYTIITDEYQEYRWHSDQSKIDRQWCNIWIIDDIIYEDHVNYEINQPEDGGTDNVLGLIAGGNVILANTEPNGAKGNGVATNSNHQQSHVRVHAAVMALRGGFVSQYWQNSSREYSDYFYDNGCVPTLNAISGGFVGKIADCRGQYRNPYIPEPSDSCYIPQFNPNYGENGTDTGNGDYRGYIYLWGSIVQQKRGYMMRNTTGPYMTNDIGFDKSYHYDNNLRFRPPPYYPVAEDSEGNIILTVSSYGQIE